MPPASNPVSGPDDRPGYGKYTQAFTVVFYIFSAAVICENPRRFGFKFDNPLASP